MGRRTVILSAVGLMIVLLLVAVPLLASRDKWSYLGPENYQLVAIAGNVPVVFNALQDRDKEKVREAVSGTFRENGVEVFEQGRSPDRKTRWEDDRPEILPLLTFKKITPQNTLAGLRKEVFEVSCKGREETIKVKLAKLRVNGKSILVAANPESSSSGLVFSPDNTKCLVATEKELWLIEAGKEDAIKISKDLFNGKTYAELRSELQKKLAGKEGPAVLWWNDNPVFSPDGSKIVYMTNRDCVASGGSSLWLYDLATRKERPLVRNVAGEHYRCKAWVDNSHVIYQKFARGASRYFIADLQGNSIELKLEGQKPEIFAVHNGLLAYTPDCTAPKTVCIAKISFSDFSTTKIYEKTIGGALREVLPGTTYRPRGYFAPDGSRLAYLFAPDTGETAQQIAIVDLAAKKEVILKEALSKEGARAVLYDFDWLDGRRLLVRVSRVVNGMSEISSWIYVRG